MYVRSDTDHQQAVLDNMAQSKRRLKVLLFAYSVAPNVGSEPSVGWNMVREISQYHDVWVITRADRQEKIDPELQKTPLPHVKWIYYDLPSWMVSWRKGKKNQNIHYYIWQLAVYNRARELHKEVGFDVMHHITYVKYSVGSRIVNLPVPLLWGPVGGGESTPKSFYETFSWKGRIKERFREVVRLINERDPFVRMTARRAAIALATTHETAERIRRIRGKQVPITLAIGISDEELEQLGQVLLRSEAPVRFLSVGRLLEWKGFHLGLQAFARMAETVPNCEYWIAGDGPQRKSLEKLVAELGITDKVCFWGKIPREDVLERFGDCDVLVHPSMHDSGGLVVMEAMAASRPVVCLKLGGPADMVTDETGYRIEAHSPQQAVSDMASAMRELATDADMRQRMGQAAREHVLQNFRWSTKAQRMDGFYRQLVHNGDSVTTE